MEGLGLSPKANLRRRSKPPLLWMQALPCVRELEPFHKSHRGLHAAESESEEEVNVRGCDPRPNNNRGCRAAVGRKGWRLAG